MGITILLATHATEVAAAAGRIMRMRDGRFIQADVPRAPPCCSYGCLGSSSCAAWRRSGRGR